MNGITILNAEGTPIEDSYTVDCQNCNTSHTPAMAPVAVELFWNEDARMWVAIVVAADGGFAHTTEAFYHVSQSRLLKLTTEEMEANLNNYFGDATEIRVFTKAGNLTKTISIR